MFNLNLIRNHDRIGEIIKEGFSLDKDLIDKWHIESGNGLDKCAERTSKDIRDFIDFDFFEIRDNDKLVGFFGTELGYFLSTFFINPEYRKKEVIGNIWNMFKSKLKPNFKSSIYAKNIPAKEFFIKNNGKIIKELTYKNNAVLVFEFKE